MKKICHLLLIALLATITESNAQVIAGYTVTGNPADCAYTRLQINTAFGASGMLVELTLDGVTSDTSIFGIAAEMAYFTRNLTTPGNYTFKVKLFDTLSFAGVDSLIGSITKLHCGFSSYGLYNDVNSNCVFDAGDNPITNPAIVEVSTGGVPVDTFSCYNNLNFMNTGVPGTVYTYRLLQPPAGFVLTCPAGGIVYDTVGVYNVPKNFGFVSSSAAGFDLSTYAYVRCGIHAARAGVLVKNAMCNPVDADFNIHFSPKYNYNNCAYTPVSILPNLTTWHFTSLLSPNDLFFNVNFAKPASLSLVFGDTVSSTVEITPTSGDLYPANNIVIRVDTVVAGFDPNDISVYPSGNITAGTELEYTVRFENTGNDTAFNIHVLDTLSNYVDFNSLNVEAASHNMNTTVYSSGTDNIIKFDFPNINLLDSSHHDASTGMFVYKIKSKTGLPFGTEIKNRVGIYFDYNPVVMTNTVINTIPFPANASTLINEEGVFIYPNPVSDLLHIKAAATTFKSATITNTIGQIVVTAETNKADATIDVRSLPSGIYFLYLKGDGQSSVQRFEKL
jgi:uncharacterized repeat protein (TIGR01451 family)